MTALLIVGCVLGYLLVGGVTSVVVAATDVAKDGSVPGTEVATAVLLWPLFLLFAVIYYMLLGPAVAIRRSWLWSVKKLNPNFKEVTS